MTTKNETIVDRVVLRLKTQPLGDLITEEDLHDIVKEAIPKVFFERQRVIDRSNSYNLREIDKDPAIVEIMRELLKDAARDLLKAWIVEHSPELAVYWKQVCDKGLLDYVAAIQNKNATEHVLMALQNWVNQMNEQRIQHNLPPFPVITW